MRRQALSMMGYFDKGKKTRRGQFLAEMGQVVPLSASLRADQAALPERKLGRQSPAGAP